MTGPEGGESHGGNQAYQDEPVVEVCATHAKGEVKPCIKNNVILKPGKIMMDKLSLRKENCLKRAYNLPYNVIETRPLQNSKMTISRKKGNSFIITKEKELAGMMSK